MFFSVLGANVFFSIWKQIRFSKELSALTPTSQKNTLRSPLAIPAHRPRTECTHRISYFLPDRIIYIAKQRHRLLLLSQDLGALPSQHSRKQAACSGSEGQTSAGQSQWEGIKGLGSPPKHGFSCINTGTHLWKLLLWTASFSPAVKQGDRASPGWWEDQSPTRKCIFVTEKMLFGLPPLVKRGWLNSPSYLLFKLTYVAVQWVFGNHLH